MNLTSINIGGGLAVEYSAYERTRFYSLSEFANDVVFTLKEIAKQKGVDEPNIFTESGSVITSYSIHYTKLYDRNKKRGKSTLYDEGFCNPKAWGSS